MEKRIRESTFDKVYKPQENHLTKAKSNHADHAPFNNTMYETYGEEEVYVREIAQKEPERVWTILDCDGKFYICSGFHFVNRHGYIVCEKPFEANANITVIGV